MLRKILSITLLVCLCHPGVVAQTSGDFNPTLPSEPGQVAKVTVSVYPTGAGSVSGGGTYSVGERKYITSSASSSNWRFVKWKNADTGATVSTSSNFYFTTVYGTTNLVAEYEELFYSNLVLEYTPEEAKPSLSGSGSYLTGRSVYVNAYVPTHFAFVNWTNKRTGKVVSTNKSFYFTKTAENDTLVANYTYSPTLPGEPSTPVIVKPSDEPVIIYHNVNVDVNLSVGGTVKTSATSVAEGGSYTVTATCKTYYEFLGWELNGDIVSTSLSYTRKMGTSDVKLTAQFQFSPARPDEPEMSEKQPEEVEEPEEPEEPEPEIPTEPSTMVGDADGNWRVENTDLVLINGYIKGEKNDAFIFKNADINRDGRVNATDASLLRHYLIFKKWTDEIIKLWEEIFH